MEQLISVCKALEIHFCLDEGKKFCQSCMFCSCFVIQKASVVKLLGHGLRFLPIQSVDPNCFPCKAWCSLTFILLPSASPRWSVLHTIRGWSTFDFFQKANCKGFRLSACSKVGVLGSHVAAVSAAEGQLRPLLLACVKG